MAKGRRSTLSLELKLPLMVGGVLLLVITTLTLASYVVVVGAERSSASIRLEREAGTVATRLTAGVRPTLTAPRALAAHPTVRAYLESPGPLARPALEKTMVYTGPRPEIVLSVEVMDARGERSAAVGSAAGKSPPLSMAELQEAEISGFGHIHRIGDLPVFPAVVPVRAGGVRLGWVVFWWHLSVGFRIEGAEVLIGNSAGAGWTNLRGIIDRPSADLTSGVPPIRYQRDGEAKLAAAVPVAETPWLVVIESSERFVHSSTRRVLTRLTAFALGLFAVACVGVGFMSRRVTKPLRSLTNAATAISGGDYSIRVDQDGPDETGQLARAFNHMAARVQEAHHRVEEQASRYQMLFESNRAIVGAAPVAVYSLDNDGIVRSWNPAAERIFGWTADEAIGQPLLTVPREAQAEPSTRLHEVESGQFLNGVELSRLRKDGGVVGVRVYAGPMHDAAGHVTGIMVVAADVTELRRLEQQYRHAQKMEAVGRLAGGIAHDFNNLLTVILGESEMALDDLADGDPTRASLNEISKAGARAGQLTRQLLAFSRQQIVEATVFPLNELVTDVERMLDRLIGEDIRLVTRLSPEPVSVRADRSQVEQLILNLAVNARDAMPDGGLLTIETSVLPGPGDYVVLSVNDSGCGMSEEVRSHIFEPFFTTKAPGRGTGLGLATCYGIVTQAGGHIEVSSEVGVGTSFKISLPRTPNAESKTMPAPGLAGGHERILLVEDQEAVRDVAARMLRTLGYDVTTAADGEAAMEMLRGGQATFDLLLTDVVLPGMNGGDLAQQARACVPGLRVLFASGYTGDVAAYQALVDTNSALIQKPFTMSALGERVRQVLDQ